MRDSERCLGCATERSLPAGGVSYRGYRGGRRWPQGSSTGAFIISRRNVITFLRSVYLLPVLLLVILVGGVRSEAAVERRAQPTTLVDLTLPLTPTEYKQLWLDMQFYNEYLRQIDDSDIKIGIWKAFSPPSTSTGADGPDLATAAFIGPPGGMVGKKKPSWAVERTSTSCHPVRTRMPGLGLPKCAVSTKRQWLMEYAGSGSGKVIILKEVNDVQGVPFSHLFRIECVWMARWEGGGSKASVRLIVVQQAVFKQPFFLERVVEKNSEKEAKETLLKWISLVSAKVGHAAPTAVHQETDERALRVAASSLANIVQSVTSLRTRGLLLFTGLLTSFLFLSQKQRIA